MKIGFNLRDKIERTICDVLEEKLPRAIENAIEDYDFEEYVEDRLDYALDSFDFNDYISSLLDEEIDFEEMVKSTLENM